MGSGICLAGVGIFARPVQAFVGSSKQVLNLRGGDEG
jgi:hypothetical protein